MSQPKTIRLWDKDYNLLWSGDKLPEFVTVISDYRPEFNTVDLKELQQEREKRRGRRTTTSYSTGDISRWLRYQNRAR